MTSPVRRLGQRDLFTGRVRRLPPVPEFNIHVQISDVLRRWAAPAWKFTHIASGEYRTPATAARLRRMGVIAGFPDILLLAPTGIAHFLEIKRRGGRLSEAQREFAEWCTAHGVPFAVAHDFDEALHQLQAWGAVRTTIKVSA